MINFAEIENDFFDNVIEFMGYYIYVDKNKLGPYSLEQLATTSITPDTLVWRQGYSDWKPAKEVYELSGILSKMPPEPPVEPLMPMPKTWFVESILVTLFCCLPFGIAAIIYSCRVEDYYNSGQYELALNYSKSAKRWVCWGFFLALALWALYILFWVGLFGFAFSLVTEHREMMTM